MVLLVAALLLSSASPALAQQITSGSLDWGVKASFRSYVEGSIGHGTVTVGDGATKNADGTYRFPLRSGSFTAGENTTDVTLGGWVRFVAHDGSLDLTIKDPRVKFAAGGSTLVADVTSKPLSGGDLVVFDDVLLAELDLSAVTPTGTTVWSAVPTVLTGAGAPAFAGFYQPGQALDPLTLRYTGPGGKPVAVDAFTPAGTPKYSQVADGRDIYADTYFPEPGRGLLHAINTTSLTAVDLTTVEPLGATTLSGVTAYAYDSETGTIFLAGTAGQPLRTATWNTQTKTYDLAAIPGTSSWARNHLAYDTRTDKLYAVQGLASGNFTDTAVPVSPAAVVIARDGAGWSVKDYPALATGGRAVSGLAVSLQGRIVATQHATVTGTPSPATISASPAVQLVDTGSELTVVEIAGSVPPKPAGSFTFGYASPTPGPGSNVTLVEGGVTSGSLMTLDTTATGFVGTTQHTFNGTVLDVAVDPVDGLIYAALNTKRTVVLRDGALAGALTQAPTGVAELFANAVGAYGGTLFLRNNVAPVKLFAYKLVATSPTVTAPPESASRTLLKGETSKSVTFQAGAIGAPAPTVQWQSRTSSAATWRDIAGATAAALAQTVTFDDNGREYRAVFTNAGGSIASAPASLEVRAAPKVLVEPADVTVVEGFDAQFKVGPSGNPYPDIQWQRRDDGFWEDIPGATGSFLTVEDANTAMSGARFRARLRNSIDTTYSRELTLTVTDPPPDVFRVAAGALDWGLKASFRSYIRGPIAHGAIAYSDGASENADGTFRFPLAGGEYDRTRRTGEFRARGTVRFTGHDSGMGPLLDMTLTNPRVVVDGAAVTLYADVKSKSLNSGAMEDFPNVRFAVLDGSALAPDLSGPSTVFGPMGATLTEPGAPAFAGFYAAGSVLDPAVVNVSSWVKAGDEPPSEEEPEVTPTPTPEATPTPTPPVVVPAPSPTPVPTVAPVRRPTLKAGAARQTVSRTGVVRVATVTCGSAACTVTRPARVSVRVGGRTYRAVVTGSTRVAAGRTGSVALRLPASALRVLGRRAVTVKVTVTVAAGSERVRRTVSVRVRGR
ncbi:HtaA domain-containing protein [Solirubrobacter phytolaccae]|nr:HtaA domain-containing protein [Solirubrobacter phytolaccae]